MNGYLENPIRIKITGKCNRNCFFCHKEGGMDIDNVVCDEKLQMIVETLANSYKMNSIALTGGEPLLHNNLCDLTSFLYNCSGIDKISITTNGTILKDFEFWRNLQENGLYKVNLSIPDLLDTVNKNSSLLSYDHSIFSNQLQTVRILNTLGVKVKINVAVINDELYTVSVLNKLLKISDLKFDTVLLPNISSQASFQYSHKIIKSLIKSLQLSYVGTRRRKNTSDTILEYSRDDGKKIFIKTTKHDGTPFCLPTLCDHCEKRSACQEGFYGIRLEQINGVFFIRLCIHKNTHDVLMPFDVFLTSNLFDEIRKMWGYD